MDKVFKILFFLLLIVSVDVNALQNDFQNFSISNGLQSNSINDIIQDEIGYLWLATDKGLIRFDGYHFKKQHLHSQSKATFLFYEKNQLLVQHTSGLFLIRNDSTLYLGNEKVNKVVSLDDKILIATNEGLYQLIDDAITPIKIQPKLDFSIINDIVLFEEAIYIASNNGFWKLNRLINPSEIHKIIEGNIKSLFVINQQLAIQFKNEIKFYKNAKIISNLKILENINSINTINNNLWINTDGDGIHLYKLPNLTFERKINKYNSNITNNINTVYKDNQNLIWIGSSDKGLYKYSLNNNVVKTSTPKIYIENISINYKKVHLPHKTLIELTPEQNNIAITYKTVNLNHSKKIQYRYRLNNVYSPWSSKNSIEFANLKSGEYQFSVQSKNGKQLSNQATINFLIDKPIYLKAWFLILLISIIFLLIALFIDIRLKQIKRKSKIEINQLKLEKHLLSLEQKALQLQMNPHFIFNVLNGIKSLGNSGNTTELNKTISQFSTLLRSVLNNSRLEEISLKDEIETLTNYLELEKKMNSKSFEYEITKSLKNIDAEEILIPPMLLQPFIENSIKHGIQLNTTNSVIDIKFEVKSNFLHCSIKDNGIGFHQSKKRKNTLEHKSVALSVTKERIENLSKYNAFSIEEIKKNKQALGTKVFFKLPLKTDY
jgi:sensor histidine kinase YesM